MAVRWIDTELLDEPEERPKRPEDFETTQGPTLSFVNLLGPLGVPSGSSMDALSNPSHALIMAWRKWGWG